MNLIKQWRRSNEVNRKGWAMFGRLWFAAKDPATPQRALDRLVRNSNRLWRLTNGKSPWRPHKGY